MTNKPVMTVKVYLNKDGPGYKAWRFDSEDNVK